MTALSSKQNPSQESIVPAELEEPSDELKSRLSTIGHAVVMGGYSSHFMKDVPPLEYGLPRVDWDFRFKDREDTQSAYNAAVEVIHEISDFDDVAEPPMEGRWDTPASIKRKAAESLFALAYMAQVGLSRGYYTEYASESFSREMTNRDRSNTQWERGVPFDLVRRPLEVPESDMQALLGSSDVEKETVVAELLDVYRYRPDMEIDRTKDWKVVSELLASMENTWTKQLLIIQSYRYFMHPSINQPELADESLQQLDDDLVADIIRHEYEYWQAERPEALMEQVDENSHESLEVLLLSDASEKDIVRLKEAAEKKRADSVVTINLQLSSLEKALFESFRLLNFTERGSSGGSDFVSPQDRLSLDEAIGIHSSHNAVIERPIHGALAVTADEAAIGPRSTQAYGHVVITIKQEIAQKRTTYTYGDSLNARARNNPMHGKLMNFEDALIARAYYDEAHPNGESPHSADKRYVEAQILGGVSVADMDSITIPISEVVGEKWSQHPWLLKSIRKAYPNIDLRLSASEKEAEEITDEQKAFLEDHHIDVVTISKRAEAWRSEV